MFTLISKDLNLECLENLKFRIWRKKTHSKCVFFQCVFFRRPKKIFFAEKRAVFEGKKYPSNGGIFQNFLMPFFRPKIAKKIFVKTHFFEKIDKKSIFRLKIDFLSPVYKYNLQSYFFTSKFNQKTAKKNFFGVFEKKKRIEKKTHSFIRFFFARIGLKLS